MATLKRNMLRHEATLILPEGMTDWQAPDGDTRIQLKRVHVQRVSGLNVNSLNQEVQTQATLWFDAKLSLPLGCNLLKYKEDAEAVGGRLGILYDGHEYSVSRVLERLDGFGRLHHYEVEMV